MVYVVLLILFPFSTQLETPSSMRGCQQNIWACSPKGDRERKKMLVSKIANAQIIKFTMEFTIENTQEIEQNFYKPNIEVSDLHVGGVVVSESCL